MSLREDGGVYVPTALAALTDRFRARLEGSLARFGLAVPWWIPLCMAGAGGVFTVVALAQRIGLQPPVVLVVAGLCATASPLVWVVTGAFAPSWLKSVGLATAAAILLTRPVVPDFAPILLVVLAAEMGAAARHALGIAVTSVGIAMLTVAGVWAGLIGVAVYIVAVLLGYAVGLVARWYIRALAAERGNQQVVREQAMLAERQRIAREVHDVLAHSLSTTLLHLTGARRALQEDEDVAEAVDVLTETERMGRAAMADVRRMVGLLNHSATDTHPLPGVDDLAGLVERSRAAGLDVRYQEHGNLTEVSAAAGLGLYRIAQESLANITKHAPHATAEIQLSAAPEGIRLTVRNSLSPATTHRPTTGSGLPGMAVRAAQLGASLRAGPHGASWEVDVTVPSAAPARDDSASMVGAQSRP